MGCGPKVPGGFKNNYLHHSKDNDNIVKCKQKRFGVDF